MTGLFFLGAMAVVLLAWAYAPWGLWWSWATALMLVLASVGLYRGKGMAGMPDLPAHVLNNRHPAKEKLLAQQDRLIAFLKNDPDSCEGWFLLGKSYEVLQRNQEAMVVKNHHASICPQHSSFH